MKLHSSDLMRTTIGDILKWIELNLSDTISSKLLSEKSGYSRWYFQRCFKEITGMTPVVYIRHRKMLTAKKLLANMECSVTDIAMCLGYSQQSTFCRAFKEYHSITPKQFRFNIASKDSFSKSKNEVSYACMNCNANLKEKSHDGSN